MSYLTRTLSEGETVIARGTFHWMHSARAIFWLTCGIVLAFIALFVTPEPGSGGIVIAPSDPPILWIRMVFAGVFLLSGAIKWLRMMIQKWTTEIAVTNLRLIYKIGLIARDVQSINVQRIEGSNVRQSIPGRILDYGSVSISGTGVGDIYLPPIKEPIEFRKSVLSAMAGKIDNDND
ncbi:MAG: PH domain-containing protein [Pseudomonadota bacterium]|nr:PH domain-containing protein [Pseudomonadota bacterium]